MELRDTSHRLPRALDSNQASRVLNAVLDNGINFIDTSIDYGESEFHIGKSISHRRSEYLLASKCGCPLDSLELVGAPPRQPLPHNFGPQNIVAGVNQSLS